MEYHDDALHAASFYFIFRPMRNRRRSIDAVTQSYLYRVVHASSRHISSIKSVGMGMHIISLNYIQCFIIMFSKVYNLSNAFQWFFLIFISSSTLRSELQASISTVQCEIHRLNGRVLSPKEFQNAVLDCLRFSSIDERMDADGEESEE